jgi:hypothetical protein
MAAEAKNGARGGAAAARSRAASLTRAQLEQKAKGQPAMLVNLRIVMSATAVTIFVILATFAGIGFLLLARTPQEPIVSKLDLSPPLVAPAKLEPASQTKTKTIALPAPVIEPPQAKSEEAVAPPEPKKDEIAAPAPPKKDQEIVAAPQNQAPPSAPDPETTATIPPPPPAVETKPQVKQRIAAPKRPRVVRRAPQKKAEPQFTNPFSQLFGGTK